MHIIIYQNNGWTQHIKEYDDGTREEWLEPDQRALILTPEGREWALRLCRARRQLETLGVPEAAAAPAAAVLLASEGAALQE